MSPMASSWTSHPAAGATAVFRPSLPSGARRVRSPPVLKGRDMRGVLSNSSEPPGRLGPGWSLHLKARGADKDRQ